MLLCLLSVLSLASSPEEPAEGSTSGQRSEASGAPEPEVQSDPEADPDPEAAPEEPGPSVELGEPTTLDPSAHEPVGSALELLDGEGLSDDLPGESRERAVWRGSTYFKPTLALWTYAGTEGGLPLELGAVLGRRFFPVREGPVLTADTWMRAGVSLGEAKGSYEVSVAGTAGPWVEFVGLHVGPMLSLSRRVFGPDALEPALTLGARGTISLDARIVQLYAGAAPGWDLWGDRPPAIVGDQLLLLAGLGLPIGILRVHAELEQLRTALAPMTRMSLGLRIRPQ